VNEEQRPEEPSDAEPTLEQDEEAGAAVGGPSADGSAGEESAYEPPPGEQPSASAASAHEQSGYDASPYEQTAPLWAEQTAPQPTQPPYGQPSQQAPPYYGYGGYPPQQPKPARAKPSGWVWPLVCALALVVGLVGGAVGSLLIDEWDDSQGPGRVSGGLDDVDTASRAPLPGSNGSITAVAQKLLPSTVQIVADLQSEEAGATGSGFVLDRQGHVVTNNHVVAESAGGGKIEVITSTGERFDAEVVGRSPVYDLAVLFVEDLSAARPAALGSSENLQVGEGVVAIGSPLGLSSTVTSGIVSALDRPVTTGGDTEDLASYINAVQTDAAINPGNSGGPLVNMRGQVVGVNSAIATTGGGIGGDSGNIGVGFAIPIEQVRVTADQILRTGEARYPVIGATVSSDGSGSGAMIRSVENGSPADEAGLQEGDMVVALGDRQVNDSPTLIVAIRSHLPGDKVDLTVERDGKERKVSITLDSRVG
jgi:putative serine protease PepD